MNTHKILSLLLLSFLLVSCSQDNATQKELAEIKQLLVQINQKLGEPKKDTEIADDSLMESYRDTLNFRRKGANLEELDQITLADNPTPKQIKEYIRKIGIASSKQNSYSDSDPQVFMLTKIGNENLELLINANLNHQGEFYAIPAITRLTQPKDKELILKYLPFKKDLVKVVIQNGWEADAKIILYNELRQIPHYLPIEWVTAIANLEESCVYDDLKQYLILGSNKKWTYESIKMLPNIELDGAVIKAWDNAKRDKWARNSFAPIALAHGQKDALGVVIESLNSSPSDHNAVRNPRKYVLQYTYASGSNNEIRDWYNSNKNNLYFDEEKRKFIPKNQ